VKKEIGSAYEIQRQGSDSGTPYVVGIYAGGSGSDDEEDRFGSCPQSRTGGGAAPEFRASTPKFGAGALRPIASKLIAAPVFWLIRVASDNVAPNTVAPKQVPHSIVKL